MRNKKQSGFTLIELLVVIAIIGVLAATALVAMNSARVKARDAKRLTDVRQIMTALELYYDTNGSYPNMIAYHYPASSQDVNWTGAFQTALSPYIAKLPVDPSGLLYAYSATNSGRSYGIMVHQENNSALVNNDGGYFNSTTTYYEAGPSPAICASVAKEWWGATSINCP